MPNSVVVNGQRRFQPGVYAQIDASALGGQAPSTGNVILVGDFPFLEQYEPQNFTSARALQNLVPEVREALDIAKCIFAPSTQQGIGGANLLGICNAQPCTQAFATLENGGGSVDELTVRAKVWGLLGNRTKLTLLALSSSSVRWTLERGTKRERYDISSPVLATVQYDGSDWTDVRFGAGASLWALASSKTCTFLAGGGAQSRTFAITEGLVANRAITVTLTNGGSGVSLQNVTVTFTGLNHLGAAASETLTAAAGGTTWAPSNTTTTLWSRLDSIVIATADATYNGTVNVTAFPFYMNPADYENVGQMIAQINAGASQGYHAATVTPGASAIPSRIVDGKAGGVDGQSLITVKTPASFDIKATIWAVEQALAGSQLVELSVPAASDGALYPYGEPPDTEAVVYLAGGSESASDGDDYTEALRVTEALDYQILVGWKTDLASMQALINSCEAAAVQGYERAAFGGAPSSQTLAVLFSDFAAKCNSPYLQLTGQTVRFAGSDGKIRTYDPRYLAALAAGVRAGTPVATPLTNKRPAIVDFAQTWNAPLDTNEAISYGLLVVFSDNLGPKFARDVTTYLEDDNPAYSAGSAWESCQTSVRDLRGYLDGQVGNPATNTTGGQILGIARARLNQQVRDGIIKDWRNLTLTDNGNLWELGYELAPVEGVDFILVTANVVRISST